MLLVRCFLHFGRLYIFPTFLIPRPNVLNVYSALSIWHIELSRERSIYIMIVHVSSPKNQATFFATRIELLFALSVSQLFQFCLTAAHSF